MMPFISILTDLLDKTFVYKNGEGLRLSDVPKGLEILNKIRADRRIDGKGGPNCNLIDSALSKVISLYNTPSGNILVKPGIDLDLDVAEALFRRVVGTLLMAIDFDYKDTNFTNIYSKYHNHDSVIEYLTEIRSIVEDSTHMYSGFKPVRELDATEKKAIKDTASAILGALNTAAATVMRAVKTNEDNISARSNICAILLGITNSNVKSFNDILNKREALIDNYKANNANGAFALFTKKEQKTYAENLIIRAFTVVTNAATALTQQLSTIGGIIYNQYSNSITIGKKTIDNIFAYKTVSKANKIVVNVTRKGIKDTLKRIAYDPPDASNEIPTSSEPSEIPKAEPQSEPSEIPKAEPQSEPPEIPKAEPQSAPGKVSLFVPDDEPSEATLVNLIAKDFEELKKRPSYIAVKEEIEKNLNELMQDELRSAAVREWVNNKFAPEIKSGVFRDSYTGNLIQKNGAGIRRGAAGYIKVIDRGNPLLYKRH
jgi:hypothetical protein